MPTSVYNHGILFMKTYAVLVADPMDTRNLMTATLAIIKVQRTRHRV
jgi:hypothetical protein